jgi:GNAT superfamily N-acetyltransferase
MASSNESDPNYTILYQEPPGKALLEYDTLKHPTEQPLAVPPTIAAASQTREDVFVAMHPLLTYEYNLDYDDPRSVHFVAFSKSPNENAVDPSSITDLESRNKFISRAIGSLRFIPFPHYHLHPLPGAVFDKEALLAALEAEAASGPLFERPIPGYRQDRKTKYHDGIEPYLKVGRMCVIPGWRGKGVMTELLRVGYEWLRANQGWATTSKVGGEVDGREKGIGWWKGLICAHADGGAQRAWEREGFVVDEEMGNWWIMGIKHVCMWKRIDLEGLGE